MGGHPSDVLMGRAESHTLKGPGKKMTMETAGPIETTPESDQRQAMQVVGFYLGEEEYAIDILEIVGIERLENVLHLPKMPSFVEGVMRIRGEIVSLVKLRSRFGLEPRANDDATRVMVIEHGGHSVGFIVDAVSSVQRFDADALEAAPDMALTVESRFVVGVLWDEESMLILLKPGEILREDEGEQLGRAAVVAKHYARTEEGAGV